MSTPSEHSVLSPSHSCAWVPCTASVVYVEANETRLSPDEDSIFAAEGTRAHLAATVLLNDPKAAAVFDNPEMAGHVNDFVAMVRDQMEPGDKMYVARKVSLFYRPEDRGELDVGIHSRAKKRITIGDFKYGQGVSVDAKGNPQLAIYAESLVAELEMIEEIPDDYLIVLVIHQPRDRNNPEAKRIWAISRKQLAEFCEPITAAALKIQQAKRPAPFDPNADERKEHLRIVNEIHKGALEFKAGDHCDKGFCRARGICDAYAARGLEVLPDETQLAVANVDAPAAVFPEVRMLTRDQRIRIIQGRKALEKWLEEVENQEMAELMAGAPRLGLKLVEGKSNRQWTDEAAVEKLLRNHLSADEVRPPGKIMSPAQAEKALKVVEKAGTELSTKFTNKLTALIEKPAGKPSLVSEDDPRPVLALSPKEGFTDLTGADCI